jgi:hypothetical protein
MNPEPTKARLRRADPGRNRSRNADGNPISSKVRSTLDDKDGGYSLPV